MGECWRLCLQYVLCDNITKSGAQVWEGGGGVEGSKSHNSLGVILSREVMILQGVSHPISCLGVCYANEPPQKGGVWHPHLI